MEEIVRTTIKKGAKPSQAQIEEIKKASLKPITFDEDSPELSYEEMLQMIQNSQGNSIDKNKELVTLRISPSAMRKAKAVGKGYTSFLSRLVENALNDRELVSRSL